MNWIDFLGLYFIDETSYLLFVKMSRRARWTGTGSVTTSGSGSSTTFTIDQPSSVVWNWETQYYLTVKTSPFGIAAISGEGWYDQASSVPLTASIVANYVFLNWNVDVTFM